MIDILDILTPWGPFTFTFSPGDGDESPQLIGLIATRQNAHLFSSRTINTSTVTRQNSRLFSSRTIHILTTSRDSQEVPL